MAQFAKAVDGSATGATSLRIYLKKQLPLGDMLAALDGVESISNVDTVEETAYRPRLFKKRLRDPRGLTPGPLQRYRLVLKPDLPTLFLKDHPVAKQLPLPVS